MFDKDIDLTKKRIVWLWEATAEFAPKVLSATFILVAGWWLIKIINRLVTRFFEMKDYDLTLERFTADLINWSLKLLLFVMVVTQLGIKSSSLLALLGAAGLAIGLALQGSLSNFAGGVLILAFRPFKVKDFIEAQGVKGTVEEISLFTTKVLTIGNQLAVIPNAKLSNDTIINFSAEKLRKNMLTFGISYDSDLKLAKKILLDLANNHKKILKHPAVPEVVVAELADNSVNLSLRYWARNDEFWPIQHYILEEAKLQLEAQGIEIPFPQRQLQISKEVAELLKS